MPTILVILIALAGFSVSFGLGSLITWAIARRERAALTFGGVCLGFAGYVALQVAILTTSNVHMAANLLRFQGAAIALVFALQAYFGAAFAGRRPDWFDHAIAVAYVALAGWSLASPAGYWFASVTALEPTEVSGGVISHPRGPMAWTYWVSIALQYPLMVRQLVDGPRMIRRGARVDGWLWTLGLGCILGAGTHDHLVDFGWLAPPYLGEYPFPLFIAAVAIRNTVRRHREHLQLRELQASLARSEARLRDLYEGSSDAIFVHDAQTGEILDVNQTMCAMYGYSREECVALGVTDLSAPGSEFTQDRALERLAEAQKQGKTSFRWQARRRDGSAFPVEVTLKSTEVAGRACVVASVRDLSQQQAAADALRQGEERYRSLFEGAGDGIVLLSEQAVFADCNARAAQLFGCESREQLVGHGPHELSPPLQPDGTPSDQAAAERVRAAFAGTPQRFEWMHQRLDGSSFLAEVSLVVVDLEGQPHLQGIVRDVTEQRRLDERLRQSQRLESIGQLAGGVAHDFNNLLMPIIGHVELILDELSTDDPMREQLDEVLAAAQRAQRLTRQLLSFGRKAVLDVRPLDLARLLGEMQSLIRKLLREDIEFEFEFDADDLKVRADASQIEQVVMNLVVNARDAMPTGGLLSLRLQHQRLGVEDAQHHGCEAGDYAVLLVSDTGVGMTPEVQGRIFEPFYTTKSAARGTGLGLSTVFGIVRQHGGFVRVYSEPGTGTVFRIYLPLVSSPGVESARPALVPAVRGNELVLVVEDDEAVRRLACRVLEKNGYRVIESSSPEAALAEFRRLSAPPDLVLTDVVMPGSNGRALYEALLERAPALRVLYMSGYSGDVISHHGVLEPGVALLEKPFAAKELLAKVRLALGGSGARAPQATGT
jgi:two-component system cell cycle sensor histidine kinase/response regulator CckA